MEIVRRPQKQKSNKKLEDNKNHRLRLDSIKKLPMLEDRKYQLKLQRKKIKKLPLTQQIMLHHYPKIMHNLCKKLLQNSHKRLDFRQLEKQLSEKHDMCRFLSYMMDNFRYVYFTADRLQTNLNALETAGVKSLKNVQHCEILMGKEILSIRKTVPPKIGAGDAGLQRVAAVFSGSMMPQWPLHTLPKMLKSLRRLKIHCEVQVHFIDQFPLLEILSLHGDVSQTAITGILERCKQLKRLFIKFQKLPAHLQGIHNCVHLEDISLPVPLFDQARNDIIKLPILHLIELTGSQKAPELTVECMRHVMINKSYDVEIIQLNCACFESPFWIRDAALSRCERLQTLVLNNCIFADRDINDLNMPCVLNYLVLSGCADLTDSQLIDIVRKSPNLSELYLIDCPQLSGKVLVGIYNLRCSEKRVYNPISIILSRCELLCNDYQDAYIDYWQTKLSVLKLDSLLEENRPIEDVQMFFYKTKSPAVTLKKF